LCVRVCTVDTGTQLSGNDRLTPALPNSLPRATNGHLQPVPRLRPYCVQPNGHPFYLGHEMLDLSRWLLWCRQTRFAASTLQNLSAGDSGRTTSNPQASTEQTTQLPLHFSSELWRPDSHVPTPYSCLLTTTIREDCQHRPSSLPTSKSIGPLISPWIIQQPANQDKAPRRSSKCQRGTV
jgi:hypothetical protein